MEAIVLAGGFATRLWPLTRDKAKPLLPLGEREIIDYLVEEIVEEPRVDNVYISTNKRFEEDFQTYVKQKGYRDVEVVVEDSMREGEKPGAIGALHQIIGSKGLEGPLLIVAGDNYVSFSVSEFIDFYFGGEGSCLAAYDLDGDPSQFGVLEVESGKVVDFEEKPGEPKSSLISIAFYVLSESGVKNLDRYMNEGLNPDSPGYFIEWLVSHEDVRAFKFEGNWFDIGTPKGYIDAYTTVVAGNTYKNSDISNSNVKKSYVEDSVVENSRVMESVVMGDAVIKNSELNRVIVEGEEIIGKDLRDVVLSDKKDKKELKKK
ncbi:sugar phosphate nucleotidyltransferase [Methanonatronarchaeum sp. AMET6-2]|uniref:sugar phosphate nucleotidyltransferase n=1 Tax=Methanonatronarchaeum sp. AMET6-2 TaxID=2933293 RepID=UPI001210E232|nr:sugar phosphate nucleotidyltransferase [Methanonatronarchaeum sp. AMET6-2]RZN61671.1 MAG: NDP-sugar synthase [Methanonatronarchaeia archaeon]UOY10156.1 sugar phosphate nucleotidyltransferase [Methanonatronarchaeum sp. AMET6-2]